MKILALTGTKRKGNSVLASQYLAKQLDAELEILNVSDLNIEPCKACYACLFGQECKIDDDVSLVFERMRDADLILISSAIYWLDATGKMKLLLDRMFMAIPFMEEFRGKMGAVIYFYGFEELRGWGGNTYNLMLRVLGIEPLAVIGINAALPGEVLKEENIQKLNKLVDAVKSNKKIIMEGQCPVCMSEVFRNRGGYLECTVCRSKLDLGLNVIEEGEVLKYEWVVDHYETLRKMKEMFMQIKGEIAKQRERYGV